MTDEKYERKDWDQFLSEIGEDSVQVEVLLKEQENAISTFRSIENQLQEELNEIARVTLPAGFIIDKFQVVKEIGRGGMSSVYLSERNDGLFDQQVAIKLLAPDLLSDKHKSYFDTERKILAKLNHPNISKILDGGMIRGGIPYLVMEFVEGVSLDKYLNERQLTLRERISIFQKVCNAVRHAHGQLILHRDLKPSNIILSEAGYVKLLDFGIGGFMDESYGSSNEAGTLRYLPPEHFIAHEYSVLSDIYQLGLLGYQLFEGRDAVSGDSRDEVIKKIKQGELEEWHKLSSIPGLRAILNKCLRSDPEARYATVDALMIDLDFFLQDKPIKALPANWSYNGWLFLKRNKLSATFSFLIFSLAIAFAIWSNIQASRIAQEKERALAANEFLTDIFKANDPDFNKGEKVTAEELLKKGERKLENIKNPTVKLDMLISLGELYQSLFLFDKAEELYVEALDMLETNAIIQRNIRRAKIYSNLHVVYLEQADYPKSDSLSLLSIEALENDKQKFPLLISQFYSQRSVIKKKIGDYEEAESLARESLELINSLEKSEGQPQAFRLDPGYQKISVLMGLIAILGEKSKLEEADSLIQEVMANYAQMEFSDMRQKAAMFNIIGNIYQLTGEYEKQIQFQKEAVLDYSSAFGIDHLESLKMTVNLAMAYHQLEDYKRSDSLYDFVYAKYLDKLGPSNDYTVGLLYNMANAKLSQGLPQEGIDYLEKVLEADIQNLGAEHPYVAGDYLSIGDAKEMMGKYEEALSLYDKSLKIYKKAFGEKHRRIGQVYALIGKLYHDTANYKKSLDYYNSSLEIYGELLGTTHIEYLKTLEAKKEVEAAMQA